MFAQSEAMDSYSPFINVAKHLRPGAITLTIQDMVSLFGLSASIKSTSLSANQRL